MRSFLLGVATSLSMFNLYSPEVWRDITIFTCLSLLFVIEITSTENKNEKEK
jgi:hypothetical protein